MGIDEYLRGGKHPEPVIEVELLKRHSMPRSGTSISTVNRFRCFRSERRIGVTEVEIGYLTLPAPWLRRSARLAGTAGSTRFLKALRKTEHVHPVRRMRGCLSGMSSTPLIVQAAACHIQTRYSERARFSA